MPTLVQVASIVQHSSASNEHYTPPQIVEPSRATLGGIDLDPCSCALAQEVVRASTYWHEHALALPWNGPGAFLGAPMRVFLNPPGGLVHPKTLLPCKQGTPGAKSSLAVYWTKLWHEWHVGNVSQAIFVCFNLEVLRLTQDESLGCAPALDFPICYLRERPRYWNESTPVDKRGAHGSPSHPGAVVYLPPRRDVGDSPLEALKAGATKSQGLGRFVQQFIPLGKCVIPA